MGNGTVKRKILVALSKLLYIFSDNCNNTEIFTLRLKEKTELQTVICQNINRGYN